MRFITGLLFAALGLSVWGCSKAPEPESAPPPPPLAVRALKAEQAFLKQVRAALKAKDEKALTALVYFDGAREDIKAMQPMVLKDVHKMKSPEVSIELLPAGDPWAQSRYTVPFLGKIVFRSAAGGQAKLPVGVKDGRYYITLLAAPLEMGEK